jgi:hypothetical protein
VVVLVVQDIPNLPIGSVLQYTLSDLSCLSYLGCSYLFTCATDQLTSDRLTEPNASDCATAQH